MLLSSFSSLAPVSFHQLLLSTPPLLFLPTLFSLLLFLTFPSSFSWSLLLFLFLLSSSLTHLALRSFPSSAVFDFFSITLSLFSLFLSHCLALFCTPSLSLPVILPCRFAHFCSVTRLLPPTFCYTLPVLFTFLLLCSLLLCYSLDVSLVLLHSFFSRILFHPAAARPRENNRRGYKTLCFSWTGAGQDETRRVESRRGRHVGKVDWYPCNATCLADRSGREFDGCRSRGTDKAIRWPESLTSPPLRTGNKDNCSVLFRRDP